MPGPEMDLKRVLFETGNRLLKPPGSVDELLAILDRVEHCLSFVEQQPPVEMQDALCPSFKALVTNELLKHPDIDVRVGVTACLTEISRITAPDVPYGDELMKEVFRLTISAFEGLSDNSSKSFGKRVSIIETVAKVRSCAVLLDLDCDGLIVEMFQNFYKCIRDFHTANVFSSMESIMTLVIEEYDEISTDLLLALLSVLKKENKDVLPVAKRLGEKVMQNCAIKLKSCIVDAIKSLKINLLDYDFVVTLACQIAADHNPLIGNSLSLPLEAVTEALPSLTLTIPSNGNVEVEEDACQGMLNTSHKLDSNVAVCPAETIYNHVQVEQGTFKSDAAMHLESVSISKSETNTEKIHKKRGRKPKIVKDMMRIDSCDPDENKESSTLPLSLVNTIMDVRCDSSVEPNVLEKNIDSSNQLSLPKHLKNNEVIIGSPSQNDSPPEKSTSERIERLKEAISTQEAKQSHQNTENTSSHRLDDTVARHVSLDKDATDGVVGDASKFISRGESKNAQDIEVVSEDNPLKQPDIQLDVTDGALRTKKRGRPRKDASVSAATMVKDGVSSESASKKRGRHRFELPEDGKEYGEDLVGSRIKVWWPADKEYYDGIIESFDPVRKRHKILYTDNEREILNLHKEKWKFLKRSVVSEKDEATCHTNASDASEAQEVKQLKTDSNSAGIMENTDNPIKKRRGRPPRKYDILLANYGIPVMGGKAEDKIKAEDCQIDSVADDGSLVKSRDSVSVVKYGTVSTLNADTESSKQDVLLENAGTQTKQDPSVVAGFLDTMAPKPPVRLDVNDPFAFRSDDERDDSGTETPKSGNSNVNVTEEVKSGPSAGQETERMNHTFSTCGNVMRHRKRKAITSSNSDSPATDPLIKRRRGRPPKRSLYTCNEKSKDYSKPVGDSKVDESRSIKLYNDIALVKTKESLVEDDNAPYTTAGLEVSKRSASDDDITKSTPSSTRMITKENVALAESSSKTTTGELKFSSSTGLKLRFKTSVSEPKLRRRRSRKITSSLSAQVINDGSVKLKRPRGRPCRLKVEALNPHNKPEGNINPTAVEQQQDEYSASAIKSNSEIIPNDEVNLGKSSSSISKNNASSMSNVAQEPVTDVVGMEEKQDSPKIGDNVNCNSVANEARS